MRRLPALLPLLFTLPHALAAIPADTHLPADVQACTAAAPCPVAVLSPGYGLAGADYGFLTRQLNGMGYLVLALRDSAGGAAIDRSAPMTPQVQAIARTNSRRIAALLAEAEAKDGRFDWRRVLLVGHSLGGDSSAQFAADYPQRVSALVSLDSRRVALPRVDGIHLLSIRASDTAADPGVLPDEQEQRRHGSCIVRIEGARHNDMQDEGSVQLKQAILAILETFLAPAHQPAYACAPAPALAPVPAPG